MNKEMFYCLLALSTVTMWRVHDLEDVSSGKSPVKSSQGGYTYA
jgi:hypothetical protein